MSYTKNTVQANVSDYGLMSDECLKMVTNKETKDCQNRLRDELENAGEPLKAKIGYPSGNEETDVLWFEEYGLWWWYEKLDTRHYNAFGVSDNKEDCLNKMNSIVCEINPPIKSTNNKTTGRFLKNDDRQYYLAHTGRFKYKNKKLHLGDFAACPKVQICDRVQSAFIVSKLDDVNLLSNLDKFVRTIRDMKTSKSTIIHESTSDMSKSYTVRDILKEGCFVAESKLNAGLQILERKKNLILQGPPGTGKTWLAKKMAHVLIGDKSSDRIKSFQFHPNISYEDFIRGWRPTIHEKKDTAGLDLIDGPFLETIHIARNDPTHKYIIIIEEINRGNPANIFGEMLTLLEADKRNKSSALQLSYGNDKNPIYIPENLYIIGTMNVADRSIAMVDMALRRRFGFVRLNPVFGKPWKDWLNSRYDMDRNLLNTIASNIESLNETIRNDPLLGPHFEIGHSYVMPPETNIIHLTHEEWFKQVVENEIGPLLEEYWPQKNESVENAKKNLLTGIR